MTKSYIILLPTVMAWWKAAACVAGGGCSVIWEYHLRLSAETATYWTQHNHQVNIWQQLELPLSPPCTAESSKTGRNVSLTQCSRGGRGCSSSCQMLSSYTCTHTTDFGAGCTFVSSSALHQSGVVHLMGTKGRQTSSFQLNDLQNNVKLCQLVQLPMLAGM